MNFTIAQQQAIVCDHVRALLSTPEDSMLDTLSQNGRPSRPYASLTEQELDWLLSQSVKFHEQHAFKCESFHNKYYMIKVIYALSDQEMFAWSDRRREVAQ